MNNACRPQGRRYVATRVRPTEAKSLYAEACIFIAALPSRVKYEVVATVSARHRHERLPLVTLPRVQVRACNGAYRPAADPRGATLARNTVLV